MPIVVIDAGEQGVNEDKGFVLEESGQIIRREECAKTVISWFLKFKQRIMQAKREDIFRLVATFVMLCISNEFLKKYVFKKCYGKF